MKRSYLAGLILMIVSLYPLSYGPVVRMVWDPRNHFTDESKQRVNRIYYPLKSVPLLDDVLYWYATTLHP